MIRVVVAGVGEVPCRPSYEGYDFREILYDAAKAAYMDAGVSVDDVTAVVSSGMDFLEGVSISDSYSPDQVGGRLKFNTLISGDSLNAFIHACMLVASGLHDVVAVTAYSKQSDIQNYHEILLNSLDPHTLRPLLPHPHLVAGLDASAYLHQTGADPSVLSDVAAKNMRNALKNPYAAYPADVRVEDIEKTEILAEPVRYGHVAKLCDYAAVVVVTRAGLDVGIGGAVAVDGFGYAVGSPSSDISLRRWGEPAWVRPAYEMAVRKKGGRKVDLVEISEPYAHTELTILSQLGSPSKTLEREDLSHVNISGGCIGMGYPLNAAGLQRLVQAVKLMRKNGWSTALVASPDNEMVDAGSIVLLSSEV
ncbi:MAG: hypothetical protein QW756_02255 [Nitrososphaerota archaeon]